MNFIFVILIKYLNQLKEDYVLVSNLLWMISLLSLNYLLLMTTIFVEIICVNFVFNLFIE